jgi:hypothetical protein
MHVQNTDNMGLTRNPRGQFVKGNSGRPQGTTNKTAGKVREYLIEFLDERAYEMPLIWDTLEDKEKVQLYVHLCKLVLPKNIKEVELPALNIQIVEVDEDDHEINE